MNDPKNSPLATHHSPLSAAMSTEPMTAEERADNLRLRRICPHFTQGDKIRANECSLCIASEIKSAIAAHPQPQAIVEIGAGAAAQAVHAATERTQRLYDLVRHQRAELHDAGLITDEEYAELASDHSPVARLEDYDSLRRKLRDAQEEARKLAEALEGVISQFDWGRAWYSDGQSEQNEKKVVKALTVARETVAAYRANHPAALDA